LKEIEDSLQNYFKGQHAETYDGGLYRALKPKLVANHIFPKPKNLVLDGIEYLKFQHRLQEIARLPKGLNLALCLMVEVNVALGILLHSETETAIKLRERITLGNFILGTAVSETGWEGSLNKLSSVLTPDLKLTGTKSFITNGGSADAVLWVAPMNGKFFVYYVDLKKHSFCLKYEHIHTSFLKYVSHIKLTAERCPLEQTDLVYDNYKKLGIELRLKELFSLVSLLLGYVETIPKFSADESLFSEWNLLKVWRDQTCQGLTPDTYMSNLEGAFPFPIDGLLGALANYYKIEDPRDLGKRNPDLSIFLWEDHFTQYLLLRKTRSKRY